MHLRPSFPTLALLALLVAGCDSIPSVPAFDPKDGRVTIKYVEPEKFTDARDVYLEGTSPHVLDELSNCLQREIRRYLPTGEKFSVTITDVDRAGDFEPWRRGLGQVRVIKGIYPPRVELSFVRTGADGQVIAQGDEKIIDLMFHTSGSFNLQNDPLYYEKHMLQKWVHSQFRP